MIANVPVRVMVVTMSDVADAPATAVVATVHPATAAVAAVHSAATAAAAVAFGASRHRSKHGKAECSARGNGQKGRFTNHDTLL
jgi:hypothetical protein